MSEPVSRRQHPFYFLVLIAEWIKPLLVPIIIFVFFNRKSSPFDWPPYVYYAILAAVVLQLGGALLSWRRFTYVRNNHQLIIRSGILFRQVKTIQRNRIHSIQIGQPLIQRLLGIALVSVETAGGGGKAEAVFRAVSLAEAREIQQLAHKELSESEISNVADDLAEVPADEVKSEWNGSFNSIETKSESVPFSSANSSDMSIQVPPSTFLQAAVTTSNLQLTLAFIAGIISFADDILGESVYDSVADTAVKYLDGPFAVLLWAAVALVLAWVLSIGLYTWKYAGFKLQRLGDQITVSYGLLEKRQLTFPIDKVQAVMLVEGLLRKPLGRGEIRLLIVQSDKKETTVMLHPYVKISEVKGLLERLVPHIRPIAPSIVPARHAWFSFLRWKLAFTAVVAAGLMYGFGIVLAWPSLLFIPIAAAWGHAQYRSEAAGMEGYDFVLRHRRLAETTAWMRRKHIQALTLKASVMQRRKGRRNVEAAVMGGLKSYVFTARLLPAEQLEQIWSWFSRKQR